MKLSEKWLRSWVNPPVTAQQLADKLTSYGLEVDGISYELPLETAIDTPDVIHLESNDAIIELNLTPNRGDCFNIAGVAREIGSLFQLDVNAVSIPTITPTVDAQLAVEVVAKSSCPRYVGRIIKNVNPQAKIPTWLVDRLARSGLKSISPIVDVTNYVMLELGQPLHAFDLARIKDNLIIRQAAPGESLLLLNEQAIILHEECLVIADQEKVLALAGIKGGIQSGISNSTQDIFLESAFFQPTSISKSARRYNLTTDSSQRFERGVDPHLPEQALARATALLLEIVGGDAGPVTCQQFPKYLPKSPSIMLREARIKRILGLSIDRKTVEDLLTRLQMTLTAHAEGWSVEPPSHRFDLLIEADLIEEIARIYGYDNLPSLIPNAPLRFMPQPENRLSLRQIQHHLVAQGFQEVLTYSFIDEAMTQLLSPHAEPLKLVNPISSDMMVMRPSLWPGLLKTFIYNQNRQCDRMRIFETGVCFINPDKSANLLQEAVIAGLITGSVVPEQWGLPAREADFYDCKAQVEALLRLTRNSAAYSFQPAEHPALHPCQSAGIYFADKRVGYVGALHPRIAALLKIKTAVFLFELNYAAVQTMTVPHARPLSKFPLIRRDLAFVVAENVHFTDIMTQARQVCGDLLRNVCLFDVYRGKGIEPGKKSLAIGLIFQDFNRTLTDDEVHSLISAVIKILAKTFKATVRD